MLRDHFNGDSTAATTERWVFDDGGRKAAGFRGDADDCVTRAIAIATGIPYRDVYRGINEASKDERFRSRKLMLAHSVGRGSSARTGVHKVTSKAYIASLGWLWTPTMHIGSGCKIHLRTDELPAGRLIVQCSRHMVAVIDGVIHDNHDSSRDGTRCVYGYWKKHDQLRFDASHHRTHARAACDGKRRE